MIALLKNFFHKIAQKFNFTKDNSMKLGIGGETTSLNRETDVDSLSYLINITT